MEIACIVLSAFGTAWPTTQGEEAYIWHWDFYLLIYSFWAEHYPLCRVNYNKTTIKLMCVHMCVWVWHIYNTAAFHLTFSNILSISYSSPILSFVLPIS